MNPSSDILLVGFGAIGALYSFVLEKSCKARVTIVSRSRYDTINERGVRIRSGKHGNHDNWTPFRMFASIEEALDRPYAYVVVTTKAVPEVQKTSKLLAPLLVKTYPHSQPTYILMQNGMNVEVDLYQALKAPDSSQGPSIISTSVWAIANMLDDCTVQHYNVDRITLGMYREAIVNQNTKEEARLLNEFGDLLRAGGCDVEVVPEIQRVKYTKNIWNATFGAASAITRVRTEAVFRALPHAPGADFVAEASADVPTPAAYGQTAALQSAGPAMSLYTIPFFHDALDELRQLGVLLFPEGDGDPGLDSFLVMNMLRPTAEMWGSGMMSHRVSMLVDVENGRPTEVEVILGEVVRMARRKNLLMPRVEGLYALMLIIQSQLLLQQRAAPA